MSMINLELTDSVSPEAVAAVYEAVRTAVGVGVEINLSATVFAPAPATPDPSAPPAGS